MDAGDCQCRNSNINILVKNQSCRMKKKKLLVELCALMLPVTLMADESANIEPLARMSLEELANLEVTSAFKAPEQLRTTPAVLYVITHDEIMQSGATSIPEALRLAPNLLVTQLSASSYTVAANGFGGNPAAQNFSNKLLMVIDGRSVYSPLFSGVYLDAQDVMMEDIDRIEVISGSGATLWGANAMNGVINIITRPSQATSNRLVSATLGNYERNVAAQYGDSSGNSAFRIYGKTFRRDSMTLDGGGDADDDWSKAQTGFRYDWKSEKDSLTVQSDAYRAMEDEATPVDLRVVGANALTRWQHHSGQSDFQLQAYYDLTQRAEPPGGAAFNLRTYDVEIQQSTLLGTRQRLVWGAGERINDYRIDNSASLLFVPSHRTLTLANLFAQDTLSLDSALALTLGMKLEDNPYCGWEAEPDVRLSWQQNNKGLFWLSASRAIRSPTPFDRDVAEKVGSVLFLTGDQSFKPESVLAYELGYRGEPLRQFSYVLTFFYNEYDDLRTIEPATNASFIPLHWDNQMQGDTYGMTTWAKWQVTKNWQLEPALRYLHKNLRFKSDASGLLGLAQAGDDPTLQASLKSTFNFSSAISGDTVLRYVGALPSPVLPAYYELNARLGWRVSTGLDLSLNGNNLLHARHLEFPAPYGYEIARSVSINASWNF